MGLSILNMHMSAFVKQEVNTGEVISHLGEQLVWIFVQVIGRPVHKAEN